jgi:hypothetical protein
MVNFKYRKREMELIDPNTGLMRCIVCGHTHMAVIVNNGKILPEAKHCPFHCGDDLNDAEFKEYKQNFKLKNKNPQMLPDTPSGT